MAATLDLLREQGASRLTTREVALRAGVSEGSVFYHFTDRIGLLTAVIQDGSRVLGLRANGAGEGGVHDSLSQFMAAVEGFLDKALVAMIAAQSDAELRTALAAHLATNDLGPHRGVFALAEQLRGQQAAGRIRADVDPRTVAFYVIAAAFLRASQRQMIGETYGAGLPSRDQLAAALDTLLAPPQGAGPGQGG
jgi:AcrR family transcriptional regulator